MRFPSVGAAKAVESQTQQNRRNLPQGAPPVTARLCTCLSHCIKFARGKANGRCNFIFPQPSPTHLQTLFIAPSHVPVYTQIPVTQTLCHTRRLPVRVARPGILSRTLLASPGRDLQYRIFLPIAPRFSRERGGNSILQTASVKDALARSKSCASRSCA